FTAQEAAGAIGTRLSLRPHSIERVQDDAKLGRFTPRECGLIPSCCLISKSGMIAIAFAVRTRVKPGRFRAKWVPVRVKKTRQDKKPEPRFRFNRNGIGSSADRGPPHSGRRFSLPSIPTVAAAKGVAVRLARNRRWRFRSECAALC